MIRKFLAASATAIVLGIGIFASWGVAVPTEAAAQGWREYDRRYAYDRRYDRRRAYRQPSYRQQPAYRQQRPVYGGGFRNGGGLQNVPAGPGGRGRAGVLPNGRGYYTPPGGQLPNGQSYETGPANQGGGRN